MADVEDAARRRNKNRETRDQNGEHVDETLKNTSENSSDSTQTNYGSGCFPHFRQNVQYKTAQEYADAVREWLWQYHAWNCMSYSSVMFPHFSSPVSQIQQPPNSDQAASYGNFRQRMEQAAGQAASAQPRFQGQINNIEIRRGTAYRIPPLWKRVAAEFIDFILLFIIKVGVTLFTVEYLGLIDLKNFDFDYLLLKGELDYEKALTLSSELIVMEIVNRVFVSVFEALCLRQGIAGAPGGSTPGKRCLGLKVVSCFEVVTLNADRVLVIPAQNIGFLNSLARSVVKNFSIAFFFPVCFTVLFFQHNRAAYDIISTSIVVERNEEIPGARNINRHR